MELQRIPFEFSICKINHIEQADFTQEFVFLSKTSDELSLVCRTSCVPPNTVAIEPGWKALKVSGILEFEMVGVIAKISNILAKAYISIFVISTFNTDYVLIKDENYENAIEALKCNAYIIK